jgi:hypothetical protein
LADVFPRNLSIEFRDMFPPPTAIPTLLEQVLREEREDLTQKCYDRAPNTNLRVRDRGPPLEGLL